MTRTMLNAALVTLLSLTPLAAQRPSPSGSGTDSETPRVEVALGYSYVLTRTVASSGCCFNMHGASLSTAVNLTPSLGLVADVGGYRAGNVQNSGLALNVFSYTFGPRFSLRREHWTPYAHALFGIAHGAGSLYASGFPGTGSRNASATILGGGIDFNLNRRFAIRAVEADWLFTKLPNGVTNRQHNLRITTGVVLRFGN